MAPLWVHFLPYKKTPMYYILMVPIYCSSFHLYLIWLKGCGSSILMSAQILSDPFLVCAHNADWAIGCMCIFWDLTEHGRDLCPGSVDFNSTALPLSYPPQIPHLFFNQKCNSLNLRHIFFWFVKDWSKVKKIILSD